MKPSPLHCVLAATFVLLAAQLFGEEPGPRPIVARADDNLLGKDTKDVVEAIALELSNKDDLAAWRRAAAFVRNEGYDAPKLKLGDSHSLLAAPRNGGFGVGGKMVGIESKIGTLAEGKLLPANRLAAEAEDLKKMAYRTAGIAELTLAATPPRLQWRKPRWELLSWEMKDEALKLAAAVEKKNPAEVQRAAKALDATCTSCHQQVVLPGALLFQMPK